MKSVIIIIIIIIIVRMLCKLNTNIYTTINAYYEYIHPALLTLVAAERQ